MITKPVEYKNVPKNSQDLTANQGQQAANTSSTCCSSEKQKSCCEPSEKSTCCGGDSQPGSCGCQ